MSAAKAFVQEKNATDWIVGHALCLAVGLPGNQITETDEMGEPICGDTFAILLNAHHEPVPIRLGNRNRHIRRVRVIDTADPDAPNACSKT